MSKDYTLKIITTSPRSQWVGEYFYSIHNRHRMSSSRFQMIAHTVSIHKTKHVTLLVSENPRRLENSNAGKLDWKCHLWSAAIFIEGPVSLSGSRFTCLHLTTPLARDAESGPRTSMVPVSSWGKHQKGSWWWLSCKPSIISWCTDTGSTLFWSWYQYNSDPARVQARCGTCMPLFWLKLAGWRLNEFGITTGDLFKMSGFSWLVHIKQMLTGIGSLKDFLS